MVSGWTDIGLVRPGVVDPALGCILDLLGLGVSEGSGGAVVVVVVFDSGLDDGVEVPEDLAAVALDGTWRGKGDGSRVDGGDG